MDWEEPQHLYTLPTHSEPPTDANDDSCYNDSEAAETWCDEEFKIPKTLRDVVGHFIKGEVDGPLKPEITESIVLALLAEADILEAIFEKWGTVEFIERAAFLRSEAVSLTPEGRAERADRLGALGVSLWRWFERSGEVTDVNMAIECLTKALELTPNGRPNRLHLLNDLGVAYSSRFERLNELVDVDKAIECQTQAVQLTPDGNANKPTRLNSLGGSYTRKFERLGELADLEKAIEFYTQAVMLTPDGHANKPAQLTNLGITYRCLFERLGELADVNKAIQLQTQAMLLAHDAHADQPAHLINLGGSYRCRFERLGDPADVDKAIEFQTQAVLLTPDGHADKPSSLSGLGSCYSCRFDRLGELADVNKAIECETKAVLLTPDGHANKPAWLNNLGGSYTRRFERTGNRADVEKAIKFQTQALLLTPDGHADKPVWLNNLGMPYLARFKHLGELADLEKAIEYQAKGVLLTPDSHARKPVWLNNLGGSYLYRFERLGELADVDQAVECQTKAVLLTPDGHADKPSWLSNLGNSYLRRFERLGERADVDHAVECQSQAVLLTPDGHAHKPTLLGNLGGSYTRRFERLGELADVDKAIECQTQALLLTPDGHADRPRQLNNLGGSYVYRFDRLGQASDVDKAIEFQTQAVNLTSDDHAQKPSWLTSLGVSYQCRFESLGELTDVNKAIEHLNRVVLLTPDGHAHKPAHLNKLAHSYQCRFERLGQPADLNSACLSFQHAAQHIVTDPETQLMCARKWAKCCSSLDISPLPAYGRCMELIPRTIWLGTTINQRYNLLTTISDLAVESAAWAISVQAYELAIEWLEQGRSVVWNQILQLRTPFDDLFAVDTVLAQRLKSVSGQLEAAGYRRETTDSSNNAASDLEQDAQHHRRLAEDWENLIEKARKIPGFHNFMRARKAEELKRSATDGPVVLINAHSSHCDALIIFPKYEDIRHIPLRDLSMAKAGEFRTQLYSSLGHRGDTTRWMALVNRARTPDDSLKAVLASMWSTIVKPILDALTSMCDTSVDPLPHVTWCATGALTFLPLHAAGPYDEVSSSAFDVVISSYTPTLGALLGSSAQVLESEVGLLVVGQESTPDLPPLPYTVRELAAIQTHAKEISCHQLSGEHAKVDAVLYGMEKHSWVHLACHATQDRDDPAQSAFYLCDGSLTLETITKRQFRGKGFAFLSACQTATGDGMLPDEAVHLAAGMLMAGYPSVIATMWPICDADGPEVAGHVYAELLKDGHMNHSQAAKALHKAVAELRKKLGEGLSERWRWVPFIHMGV